ncbi:MAG TPA: hypothetical protein DCE56_28375 [Cyanobacteria bacterium UBA8553]|nr:hypothetical protein [Cyanobacteria bacterium UBA8553]HAJ62066.1 hypothetical protein [Cyanobacteria bacterium UBA8543]
MDDTKCAYQDYQRAALRGLCEAYKEFSSSAKNFNFDAKALALANLYTENGLIADAIATLEKLLNNGVQTAPIYRTLGDLYLKYLLLVPQANVYYSKAVELVDAEDVEEQKAAQDGLKQVQKALADHDSNKSPKR